MLYVLHMVSYILFSLKSKVVENMQEVNACIRTSEMAQQAKVHATKPDDLNSISGTHRGDNQLSWAILWVLHVDTVISMCGQW